MFSTLFFHPEPSAPCKEGDPFKDIRVLGEIFPIYYGYYEYVERGNPLVDPMPIYPDFLKNPVYTKDGKPFVTKMQDACQYYEGTYVGNRDCAECAYYIHGDELLGICGCSKNCRIMEQETI